MYCLGVGYTAFVSRLQYLETKKRKCTKWFYNGNSEGGHDNKDKGNNKACDKSTRYYIFERYPKILYTKNYNRQYKRSNAEILAGQIRKLISRVFAKFGYG